MNDPILNRAQKRVKQKKGFYQHLTVYVACGVFFFLLNILTMDPYGRPEFWFFFPLLPWGIGLFIHYANTFGFPGIGALTPEWEAEQIKKEVQRLKEHLPTDQRNNYSEEEELDLNNFPVPKKKEEDWNKGDLV